MYDPGAKVYRATVVHASSATGDIDVVLSTLGYGNGHISISKIGREPHNGVWKVPVVGQQILVTGDDDSLSNAFLIPSSSFSLGEDRPGNHSVLEGLANDDHPQYLRTDGSRALSGPLTGNLTVSGDLNVDDDLGVTGNLDVDGETHTLKLFVDDIEIDPSGATVNQSLVFDGVKFVPSTLSTAGSGGGGEGGPLTTVRYAAIVPHGSQTATINHGLGSADVMVEVHETSTGNTILCGVQRINSNTITLTFDDPPELNQYKVVVFYPPATVGGGGGGGSGSTRVEYQQTTPASQWSISHSLNGYPLVSVTDSSGTQIFGDVTYPSTSQVIVDFTAPFTGVASLI